MTVFIPLQPNKLSDNLVQQFLLPDQTPSILEAEMSLRAEQLINNSKQGRTSSSPRDIVPPEPDNTRQDVTPETPRQQKESRSQTESEEAEQKEERIEREEQMVKKEERMVEVEQVMKKEEGTVGQVMKKEEGMEERQDPDGRQADTTVTEHDGREVCILYPWIRTGDG